MASNVAVNHEVARYVGRYRLTPEITLEVAAHENRLMAQLTGQPAFELYPNGPATFKLVVIDAAVRFEQEMHGLTTRATIVQGGIEHLAVRVGDDVSDIAFPPRGVEVPAEERLTYIGRYAVGPNQMLTVTEEAERLFVRMTGQPPFPLAAETRRRFSIVGVDAYVVFDVDNSGGGCRVTLYQNGRNVVAQRIIE